VKVNKHSNSAEVEIQQSKHAKHAKRTCGRYRDAMKKCLRFVWDDLERVARERRVDAEMEKDLIQKWVWW